MVPPPPPPTVPQVDPRVRKRQRAIGILILAAVPLLFAGAMLYIAASPAGTHMELEVIESPSATGGVVLDAPTRVRLVVTGERSTGGAMIQYEPWETHDLDPADHRVGEMVDVQVHSDCLCDPFIDDGSAIGQALALALVALGIAAAGAAFVVNRWRGSPTI